MVNEKIKTIEERLKDIAFKALELHEYSDETIIPLDRWIFDANERSKQKWIHQIFPFFEEKEHIEKREIFKKQVFKYRELKGLLNYTLSSEILDLNKIKNSYTQFERREKSLSKNSTLASEYFNIPWFVKESLFQFPDVVEKRIKPILEMNIFEGYGPYPWGEPFSLLCKYSLYNSNLTKNVLEKVKEGFEFNKNYLDLQKILERVQGFEFMQKSNRNFNKDHFKDNLKEYEEFMKIPEQIRNLYLYHGPEITPMFGGGLRHGEKLEKRVSNYKSAIELLEEAMK